MAGPLEGLRIIELAGIGPSPYACMLLADLGADILRLERGDVDAAPTMTGDLLARSRPSVAIDLKVDAGRSLVLELSERADVLIEAFRPGVAERLGLGPDDVRARNPRLVYARMTGYGQDGPLSQRAGHDINYIAVSGALWPLGRYGERPLPPTNFVGDFGGGSLFLALGVLSAVLWARSSGEGQVVDVAMVDGSASMMTMMHSFINSGYWHEARGTNILDTGAHFYEVYETSDGGFMAVGAIEAKFYRALLVGLGLADEELPAQMDRESWPMMKERFSKVLLSKTRDQWTVIFDDLDACVTPVLSPSEAVEHPYNARRHVFTREPVVQPMPAPRFSKTPGEIRSEPRAPGSGTRDGLRAWGISEERIIALGRDGAFG